MDVIGVVSRFISLLAQIGARGVLICVKSINAVAISEGRDDAEGPAARRDSCYLAAMAKHKKPVAESPKTGQFVVGSAGFGKISAVEGIRLTAEMEKRAGDARAKGLTADEHRRTIIRSYRKD